MKNKILKFINYLVLCAILLILISEATGLTYSSNIFIEKFVHPLLFLLISLIFTKIGFIAVLCLGIINLFKKRYKFGIFFTGFTLILGILAILALNYDGAGLN